MEQMTMMRCIRKQKQMNMTQLSVKCGLSLAALYNYEEGNREPSITRAEKIADALGYKGKLSDLFKFTYVELVVK